MHSIFSYTNVNKKTFTAVGGVLILAVVVLALGYYASLPPNGEEEMRFVVPQSVGMAQVYERLESEGVVRSSQLFQILLGLHGASKITPGGYTIPPRTGAWQLAGILAGDPDMVWVVVVDGWRKEQIADQLEHVLGWSETEVQAFLTEPARQSLPVTEGVYFPDTYLIPIDEGGRSVAMRMINNFNEQFGPYYNRALEENIKWSTLLKVASLIQREAGRNDMPVVASVIWNRLDIGMKLDIDATLQYALNTKQYYDEDGLSRASDERVEWWSRPSGKDKQVDSPYNTYTNPGLPPQPIANPGLPAIEAAINPADTDCLFYLHDNEGEIRCAQNYDEHLDNIEKYLR